MGWKNRTKSHENLHSNLSREIIQKNIPTSFSMKIILLDEFWISAQQLSFQTMGMCTKKGSILPNKIYIENDVGML